MSKNQLKLAPFAKRERHTRFLDLCGEIFRRVGKMPSEMFLFAQTPCGILPTILSGGQRQLPLISTVTRPWHQI